MKNRFLLGGGAMVLATMFATCSNEEKSIVNTQVRFMIGSPVMRTVTDVSTGVTTFQEQDKIAIYSKGLAPDMKGVTFTVGTAESLTQDANDKTLYQFDGNKGATFYAYYPIMAIGTANLASFAVATDQSTNQSFTASDFMTAIATSAEATGQPISLNFSHRMTLVKVELGNIAASSVIMNGVKSTVVWDFSSDVVSLKTDSEVVSIKMGKNVKVTGTSEYWAVVPAQTIAAGSTFITVTTTDGKSFSSTASTDLTLVEGGILRVNLSEEVPPTSNVVVRNKKLYVDGKEFFIKGVACNGHNVVGGTNPFWEEAINCGANTIRTYSVADLASTTADTKKILDDFATKGVYVNFGISLGRECEGFDYNDEANRTAQIAAAKQAVDRYKGHPAILMWCIGNEVDQNNKIDGSGTIMLNVNVWKDINEIALYIKEVDGRPTTTALTNTWEKTVTEVKTYIPTLDILSINSYDPEIKKVNEQLTAQNLAIPYIISEYGTMGTWDSRIQKTTWGGLIEPTSTEKAADYKMLYTDCITANASKGCIGSFVFLWGYQSHGDVLTWYGMFDQFEKAALPAVGTMSELWTGQKPTNDAPVISSKAQLTINGLTGARNVILSKNKTNNVAKVEASDPDGDALTYDWRIIKDVRLANGELMPGGIAGLIQGKMSSGITFTAPSESGNYRLIVYVRDKANKKAGCAVIPFQVN